MDKFKLFVENFFVYGLGGIISKIVPFFMIPIVTRIMPNTAYFGISDLSNTLVSLAGAIAIMGMYDAMYRMFFEKEEEEYKKAVCSTAFIFTIVTSITVSVLMILSKNAISKFLWGDVKYTYLVYIAATTTFVSATNTIIAAPTRMQNKRMVFLIANTISPILSYSICIPILRNGYYTIALPIAGALAGMAMELSFYIMNRRWFKFRRFDMKLLKQMLVIAVPLFPNFLVYWIFNSCDRVMITNLIGVDAAGIYAVSAIIGSCSQLIYTAFGGGWQYFAFSTMKEDNQVKSNSLIFEYLGIISFVCTAFICAWSFLLFKIVFDQRYLSGYIAAPYLFLAPLLQMLFQVAANQFLVVKKTWPNMLILSSGAVLNIVINFTLIPILGIEGAAIATLAGYVVSDILCVIILCKMKLMVVSGKFITASIIMVGYMGAWRIWFSSITSVGTIAAILVSFVFILLYRSALKQFIGMLKGRREM